MPHTAIGTINARSLNVVAGVAAVVTLTAAVVGSLLAPSPWTHVTVKGTKCVAQQGVQQEWFWPSGAHKCQSFLANESTFSDQHNVSLQNIVFAFQFPPTKLGASRWQQRLAGLLRLRLLREKGPWPNAGAKLSLITRLGYTDGNDTSSVEPTLLADSIQDRQISCHLRIEHEFGGSTYDCSPMPLLVLYSLYHDHYIINIKVNSRETLSSEVFSEGFPYIQDLYVSFISQNGHYMKVLVALQTVFFPLVAVIFVWYLRILRQLCWSYTYFQMILMMLAVALLLINFPWTYVTLLVNCPWLVILQELSLGVFYGTLMTFLHFLTHLYLEPVGHCPKVRTAMMQVIGGYTATIFLIDFMENAILVHNPLPFVWESLHLGLATITVLLVVAYLTYITVRVYSAVKVLKKSGAAENSEMDAAGFGADFKLHKALAGARWREIVLLLVSWICVLLTAVEFIIKRLHDGMWIWEDILGNLEIENTSGVLLGVYSLWNVFTCVVLLVYPPVPPPVTSLGDPLLDDTLLGSDSRSELRMLEVTQQPCTSKRQSQLHQAALTNLRSQGESEVTVEMPTQPQPRLRPRPPLRRQDAIDIVSEDSVEGVAISNTGASMDSASGDPVVKLAVVHADGLISCDDAVSVYLISGDSIVSADAPTIESVANDSDNPPASSVSGPAVTNGTVFLNNGICTNACTTVDGAAIVNSVTTSVSDCNSVYGTPALSCDSTPGNASTSRLNVLNNVAPVNRENTKLICHSENENTRGSVVLVNGVTVPSIDEDSSDIAMIDDFLSHDSDYEVVSTEALIDASAVNRTCDTRSSVV